MKTTIYVATHKEISVPFPEYCRNIKVNAAKNPKLHLCDEPTGAMEYQTGKSILKLLQDTCRQKGMTVIVITHNSAIAPMADRIIEIKNGQVSRFRKNPNPIPVETIEW